MLDQNLSYPFLKVWDVSMPCIDFPAFDLMSNIMQLVKKRL